MNDNNDWRRQDGGRHQEVNPRPNIPNMGYWTGSPVGALSARGIPSREFECSSMSSHLSPHRSISYRKSGRNTQSKFRTPRRVTLRRAIQSRTVTDQDTKHKLKRKTIGSGLRFDVSSCMPEFLRRNCLLAVLTPQLLHS